MRPPLVGRAATVPALLLAIGITLAGCGTPEPPPSGTPVAHLSGLDPTATLTSGLAAFEGRLRDATTREGFLVRSLAQASGSGTAADMRLAVGQMRTWVEGERTWLAANPSEQCYELAVAKFDEALDAMDASADGFLGAVEVSLAPSDDVTRGSIGTAAAQSLQDAGRALLDAATLAKTARTNCR